MLTSSPQHVVVVLASLRRDGLTSETQVGPPPLEALACAVHRCAEVLAAAEEPQRLGELAARHTAQPIGRRLVTPQLQRGRGSRGQPVARERVVAVAGVARELAPKPWRRLERVSGRAGTELHL